MKTLCSWQRRSKSQRYVQLGEIQGNDIGGFFDNLLPAFRLFVAKRKRQKGKRLALKG